MRSLVSETRPGVDFIKVGHKAQIIEIALSICALRLAQLFEKFFIGAKVGREGAKTVYEIDPRQMVVQLFKIIQKPFNIS